MKSKHGRQQLEGDPCLLRSPRVVGRSTWHRHFFEFLVEASNSNVVVIPSPMHPAQCTRFFRTPMVLLWEINVPQLGHSQDTWRLWRLHTVLWEWLTTLVSPRASSTQIQLQFKREFERGISWHSTQWQIYSWPDKTYTQRRKGQEIPTSTKGKPLTNLNATSPSGDHE